MQYKGGPIDTLRLSPNKSPADKSSARNLAFNEMRAEVSVTWSTPNCPVQTIVHLIIIDYSRTDISE